MMLEQILKIIQLYELIDEKIIGRPISLGCLDKMREQLCNLEYAYSRLERIIENESEFDQNKISCKIDLRIAIMDICSSILNQRKLFLLVLSKRRFEVEEFDSKNLQNIYMTSKYDIIELLEKTVAIVKRIFIEDAAYSVRICEIERGYSEIEKLKLVLKRLEKYLDLVEHRFPINREQIKKHSAILDIFFVQIECHIEFIRWLTDFWVDCRFLQLHDE